MSKVAHVIGNGKTASLYQPSKGLKITCNVPPFAVANVYTTCMVDFKMMKAIEEGSVKVPGDWVLGFRPKKWMEMKPNFYMKYAPQVKEFYTELPKYAKDYTSFNCGHMATHYTANKLEADEIHMYGFDSVFSFDVTSSCDTFLVSDRSTNNTQRLTALWRPIWEGLFNEFSSKQFILHYHKDKAPLATLPSNVEVRVSKK
jgi:hypothetical protein